MCVFLFSRPKRDLLIEFIVNTLVRLFKLVCVSMEECPLSFSVLVCGVDVGAVSIWLRWSSQQLVGRKAL